MSGPCHAEVAFLVSFFQWWEGTTVQAGGTLLEWWEHVDVHAVWGLMCESSGAEIAVEGDLWYSFSVDWTALGLVVSGVRQSKCMLVSECMCLQRKHCFL